MKDIVPIEKSSLLNDTSDIIEQAQQAVYHTVNVTLIMRNWLLGMRIHKEVLKEKRAEYGEQVLIELAKQLTQKYGRGFNKSNLYLFVTFYLNYPNIFQSQTGKSNEEGSVNIFQSLTGKKPILLSWTHYSIILQEKNADARDWYEREAANEVWSTRTLQRNVSSQYYHRMLMSQHKELVHKEMIERTSPLQDKMEFIKNPVIAEFLGFPQEATFTESELETSIINNLQKFIMELGKGYAFVARQQHIHTEKEDYYIDLVFYNYILKCFVLIDLKTEDLTHQDIGQMQMYVNYYTRELMNEGDNPPIGILLCADKSETLVRYTLPEDSYQIYAAKYLPYMPTEEELKRELKWSDFSERN